MGIGRRTTSMVLLGVVLTLLTACSKQGCTNLPVTSGIQVQVPPAIQKVAHTLRVKLCQGQHCKALGFASRSTGSGGAIAKGVTRHADAYDLDLARFGSGWQPGTTTRLTILGTTRRGAIVLRHTEQFTFTAAYPNGKDCDDVPSLTHGTSVGGADLVG